MAFGYAAVTTLVGAQIAYFYGQLPDVVASHFNANGLANGYMSRAGFLEFYVGLVVFLVLVFVGVSALVRAVPMEMINLPNKAYWFTGEREASSRAWLSREVQGFGLVFVAFIAAVMQQVFVANTTGARPCLPTTFLLVCLGGVSVAMTVMTVRMFRRFS